MTEHHVLTCPDCKQGKHDNCDGVGWCTTHDEPEPCPCFELAHGPVATFPHGEFERVTGDAYPSNPEVDDFHRGPDGIRRRWNGTVWVRPVSGSYEPLGPKRIVEINDPPPKTRAEVRFTSAPGVHIDPTGPTAHRILADAIMAANGWPPRPEAIQRIMAVVYLATVDVDDVTRDRIMDETGRALQVLGVTPAEMAAAVRGMGG